MAMQTADLPITGRQRTWRRVKLIGGVVIVVALSALGGIGMALGLLSSSAPQ